MMSSLQHNLLRGSVKRTTIIFLQYYARLLLHLILTIMLLVANQISSNQVDVLSQPSSQRSRSSGSSATSYHVTVLLRNSQSIEGGKISLFIFRFVY